MLSARMRGPTGVNILHLSDTHGRITFREPVPRKHIAAEEFFRKMEAACPSPDVIVHSGDGTGMWGALSDVDELNLLFCAMKERFGDIPIIYVPGNHCRSFFEDPKESRKRLSAATVLIRESFRYKGVHFYGDPIVPYINGNCVFEALPGEDIQKDHWDKIPLDTTVLITHCPPATICDRPQYPEIDSHGKEKMVFGDHLGCPHLLSTLKPHDPDSPRPRIAANLFGHIQGSGGMKRRVTVRSSQGDYRVWFYNSAICDEVYYPVHPPQLVEFL